MFKPMLAANTEIKKLKLPIFVSRKLEGVRAEFTPTGLVARSFKTFNNRLLAVHFSDLIKYCISENIYAEAEIYCHGMDFNTISGICRKHGDTNVLHLHAHLFDLFDPEYTKEQFQDRYRKMEYINDQCFPHIKLCTQTIHYNQLTIEEEYNAALEEDYEGLCFKAPEATYKFGRSTHGEHKFLRIKPDDTFDGTILEIVERMENLVPSEKNELGYLSKKQDKDMKASTGMAAVAIVRCENFRSPVRVTLSKNLTDADRVEIWRNKSKYIGRHLQFKGMLIKGMDLPRSPRFDHFRTDLD